MTTIVLVDSDRQARSMAALALTEAGYSVAAVNDGTAARAAIRRLSPGLVLLEADLPKGNGFDLCAQIRKQFEGAVIFLANRAALEDRVRGLQAGADDYIAKPFEPSELLARVEAVGRRYRGALVPAGLRLSCGSLTLDALGQFVVLADGRAVTLTPTEARLLYVLMQHAGQVLHYREVLALVWGETVPQLGARNLVAVHIYRLRAKIEHDTTRPRHILTVEPSGYCFAPEPSDALASPAAQMQVTC